MYGVYNFGMCEKDYTQCDRDRCICVYNVRCEFGIFFIIGSLLPLFWECLFSDVIVLHSFLCLTYVNQSWVLYFFIRHRVGTASPSVWHVPVPGGPISVYFWRHAPRSIFFKHGLPCGTDRWVSLFPFECSRHVPDLFLSWPFCLLANNTVCGVVGLGYR